MFLIPSLWLEALPAFDYTTFRIFSVASNILRMQQIDFFVVSVLVAGFAISTHLSLANVSFVTAFYWLATFGEYGSSTILSTIGMTPLAKVSLSLLPIGWPLLGSLEAQR
jgi:hypothetical protein